jgi:hypothetical protein
MKAVAKNIGGGAMIASPNVAQPQSGPSLLGTWRLVSYLELIAPGLDAKPSHFISDLTKLDKLTPIGWAVSGPDAHVIQERLSKNGFFLTGPKADRD